LPFPRWAAIGRIRPQAHACSAPWLEFSPMKPAAAKESDEPGNYQGTADFYHQIADALLPKRIRSLTMRQRLTRLLTCSLSSRRWLSAWFALCCSRVSSSPCSFLVGMRSSTCGSVKAGKPRSCSNRLRAEGIGGDVSNAFVMDTAAISVAQKEEVEESVDEEPILDLASESL
jgi:hypothetical protein